MNTLKKGDKVKIIGNGENTVWATGWIVDIKDKTARIIHGSNDYWGIYGGVDSPRTPLEKLRRID